MIRSSVLFRRTISAFSARYGFNLAAKADDGWGEPHEIPPNFVRVPWRFNKRARACPKGDLGRSSANASSRRVQRLGSGTAG